MIEREDKAALVGTRVATHWTGPDGRPVPVEPARETGVVIIGCDVICNRSTRELLLRTFGILPAGVELPAGWYVVEAGPVLKAWRRCRLKFLRDLDEQEDPV